jgi:hypothetical protein
MSRVRVLFTTAALVAGAISLSTPSSAQCVPNNFPANWLQQQENAGGHTIANHVGWADWQLTNRLMGNNPPLAAGSYPAANPPEPVWSAAQATIAQGLTARAQAINLWAANAGLNAPRAEAFQAAATIGRVATQQAPANVFNTQTFCVVLRADGNGGCRVLTSFPTPALHGYCN